MEIVFLNSKNGHKLAQSSFASFTGFNVASLCQPRGRASGRARGLCARLREIFGLETAKTERCTVRSGHSSLGDVTAHRDKDEKPWWCALQIKATPGERPKGKNRERHSLRRAAALSVSSAASRCVRAGRRFLFLQDASEEEAVEE